MILLTFPTFIGETDSPCRPYGKNGPFMQKLPLWRCLSHIFVRHFWSLFVLPYLPCRTTARAAVTLPKQTVAPEPVIGGKVHIERHLAVTVFMLNKPRQVESILWPFSSLYAKTPNIQNIMFRHHLVTIPNCLKAICFRLTLLLPLLIHQFFLEIFFPLMFPCIFLILNDSF